LKLKRVGATCAAAFMLCACATQDPSFTQHSYEQLGYDPRVRQTPMPEGRPQLLAASGFPYLSEEARDHIDELTVVPALNSELGFQSDTGEMTNHAIGLLGGAAAGFAFGAQAFEGASCSGDAAVFCLVLIVPVLAVTTVGGAVVGVASAEANRQEASARQRFVEDIAASTEDVQPTERLAIALQRRLGEAQYLSPAPATESEPVSDELTLEPTTPDGPLSEMPILEGAILEGQTHTNWRIGGTAVNAPLPEAAPLLNADFVMGAIDEQSSTLLVAVPYAGLLPVEGAGRGQYSLAILAEAALAIEIPEAYVPHPDEAILTRTNELGVKRYAVVWRRVPLITPARPFSEWQDNGVEMFNEELDVAVDAIAARMADYALLMRRIDSPAEGAPLRVAATTPEYREHRFSDDLLWALNPLDFRPMPSSDVHGHDNACRAPSIPRRNASFAWTAAPLHGEQGVMDVRYDFRLFDDRLNLTYSADALIEPSLTLPIRLDGHRIFYWTARARFVEDGHDRVTDWAVCGTSRTPFPYQEDLRITEFYPARTHF